MASAVDSTAAHWLEMQAATGKAFGLAFAAAHFKEQALSLHPHFKAQACPLAHFESDKQLLT